MTVPERRPDWWMVLAIVLLGVGMLVGFTFAGLNRLAINDQQRRFQKQTTQDIVAAKAAAIAAADAETLAKVCALAAKIPSPPVSTAYQVALGCPPGKAGPSALPAPSATGTATSSGAAAGSNRLDQPGRTSTTAAPAPSSRPGLTSPQPRPSSSPPPHPSMSPPPTPLLCLIQPIVQIGACP